MKKTPTPIARVAAPVAAPIVAARTIVLTRRTTPRKGSSIVFASPALRGTVRFPASAFVAPPDSLTVSAIGFADPITPKAKMTKEERKAARAAMTPAMKAERARAIATRAAARAAKLEAAAATV